MVKQSDAPKVALDVQLTGGVRLGEVSRIAPAEGSGVRETVLPWILYFMKRGLRLRFSVSPTPSGIESISVYHQVRQPKTYSRE